MRLTPLFACVALLTACGGSGVDEPTTPPTQTVTPFLSKPFAGEFITINPMDHDTPEEFVDANGYFVAFWGERITAYSSHSGYDYIMPENTPLKAAASGTVRVAGSSTFFCPTLNRSVNQLGVVIVHTLPGGAQFETYYAHLNRIDVTVGQTVASGASLGTSGNTGCSSYPHLHFQVDRLTGTNNGARATVDPYGWTGAGADPWNALPRGAKSTNLWIAGQAPEVRIGLDTTSTPFNGTQSGTTTKPIGISVWSMGGADDATSPNNEFVEIKIDPRRYTAATYDLTGHSIKNNAGDRYTFPSGTVLRAGVPLRVFTGTGTNSATALYWGRTAPAFANTGDCAQLFFPAGTFYLMGNVACR
jgi:murein DD-endopeptidase MepM/ murein hydrolase activator NlpD